MSVTYRLQAEWMQRCIKMKRICPKLKISCLNSMCQTTNHCHRWEKVFKSHNYDRTMITFRRYFPKVQMSQDDWGDECYTNVTTAWKIVNKNGLFRTFFTQGLCMWHWARGNCRKATEKSVFIRECDHCSHVSNQPWHILICPQERKCTAMLYTCSHVSTPTHMPLSAACNL